MLLWSTDPLVHDVSGDNQQVALRNLSSQHTASAVNKKISTKTKHQYFRTFDYLQLAWFDAMHCILTSNPCHSANHSSYVRNQPRKIIEWQ